MGTTLTGTTPQDTYDSLIKVTDNGPLSGTAKYLSDGLGNDSILALSTSFVGIGTNAPDAKLHSYASSGSIQTLLKLENASASASSGSKISFTEGGTERAALISQIGSGTTPYLAFENNGAERMRITSAGSVLVGTSSSDLTRNMIVAGTAGMAVQYAGNAGTYFDIAPAAANGAVTLTADARTGAYPDMIFRTSAAEQVRITSGGVLQLTQGQIKFPATQVASADPNTLDDYEEGTWTPVFRGSTAAGSYTYDATVSGGGYRKIGSQVTVWGTMVDIQESSAGTGIWEIAGLPFTVGNNLAFVRGNGNLYVRQSAAARSSLTILFSNNASTLYPSYNNGSSDASQYTIAADFAAFMDIGFVITYFV